MIVKRTEEEEERGIYFETRVFANGLRLRLLYLYVFLYDGNVHDVD